MASTNSEKSILYGRCQPIIFFPEDNRDMMPRCVYFLFLFFHHFFYFLAFPRWVTHAPWVRSQDRYAPLPRVYLRWPAGESATLYTEFNAMRRSTVRFNLGKFPVTPITLELLPWRLLRLAPCTYMGAARALKLGRMRVFFGGKKKENKLQAENELCRHFDRRFVSKSPSAERASIQFINN